MLPACWSVVVCSPYHLFGVLCCFPLLFGLDFFPAFWQSRADGIGDRLLARAPQIRHERMNRRLTQGVKRPDGP